MQIIVFWGRNHTLKDERAERCREKGLSIRRIRGDGNCRYTCLGKCMELDGDQIRQMLIDRLEECWQTIMEHDLDGSALAHFIEETQDRTKVGWSSADSGLCAHPQADVEVLGDGIDPQSSDGSDPEQDNNIIRALYINCNKWGKQPNHHDLLHPHVEVINERPKYEERESDNTDVE
eukprot:1407363-Heterocapsa_arctica.AAC.1